MSNVTATIAATVSAPTVAPVTPAEAYFEIAQQFMIGARVLGAAPECALALAHLCGHISECLFKAFLSWKCVPESTLKAPGVGHDISALRAMAVAHGLSVDPIEPEWLTWLSSLHARPFQLRYPVGLNGIVSPDRRPMLADLEALLELVRAARP